MHGNTHFAERMWREALSCFVMCLFVVMLGCRLHNKPENDSVQLNLNKLGPFPEAVKFDAIRTYAELPRKVRDRIGSNVSNRNGPFNAGDLSIPGIPDRRMIFGYRSDHYYLVCYEKGGIAHEFIVALFEVSGDQAVAKWAHSGKKLEDVEGFRKQIEQSSLPNEVNEIVW